MKTTVINLVKANWKSGLTVGLVSIPLAVSLAVASHTTPIAGVITAIWAGIIASIFGGSNYNIIGPTGALAGVLILYSGIYGGGCLPMLAILSGVFIFLAYIFKLEKYLTFIPGSALHGFILGVSLIITFNQLEFIFGFESLPKHQNILGTLYEVVRNIHQAYVPAIVLFAIMYACLMLFARFIPSVPGAIILAPAGIGIGYLCSNGILPWHFATLGSKYHAVQTSIFQLPSFTFHVAYLLPALSIAAISILETMISARIADGLTKTKYNKRKEMLGLSLANIGSGLAGGIPATAALARTALNIKSGCTHKISAAISSIGVALMAVTILYYFQYLPLAVIAAILVFVSAGMLETEHFWYMYQIDKTNFIISLVVAFFTIYEDAIVGILLGAVIAMLLLMQKLSAGYHEAMVAGQKSEPSAKGSTSPADAFIYAIKGPLAYINAQSHLARIESIPPIYTNVILNLREVHFIDLDGVEAFGEIIQMLKTKGKHLFVADLNPVVEHLLRGSTYFHELKERNRIYPSVPAALDAIALSGHAQKVE